MTSLGLTRRTFLHLSAVASAVISRVRAQRWVPSPASPVKGRPQKDPCIAMQVGAVSFYDEGVEKVLDIFQEKAGVNTLWLNTYTYGRGTGGRQVPGQPLPDHGVQEYDPDYHGGAFYDYDPRYFTGTILDDFRAPDYKRGNVLEDVLPSAKSRGMDVYVWDYNNAYDTMPSRMPNYSKVLEIDVYGRRTDRACFNNRDYRNHLISKIEDYHKSYPEIAGIAWGCERMGPLMNMMGGGWNSTYITCFCEDCRRLAQRRGINIERARQGYMEMDALFQQARKGVRPNDGFFVSFWRLLLRYPEILSWETLWTDSYHDVRAQVYGVSRAIAPAKPFGFHIMHMNSFNPFYRAEEDYRVTKGYADYLKVVMYNNAGGPRLARYIRSVHETVFKDAEPSDFLPFLYKLLNYDEVEFDQLSTTGLSSDYVFRETGRAVRGVDDEIPIYPGIDVDIPTPPGEKRTTPEDVRGAVTAAFRGGAKGIIISRKYSEMKLANLAGVGQALRDLDL